MVATRGRRTYPHATELLILADSGGSNGARVRAWKYELQRQVVEPFDLSISVCHYPTGASKWNPIEHRLFSEISKHWAGQPLDSYPTILRLISRDHHPDRPTRQRHPDHQTLRRPVRRFQINRCATSGSRNTPLSPSGTIRSIHTKTGISFCTRPKLIHFPSHPSDSLVSQRFRTSRVICEPKGWRGVS